METGICLIEANQPIYPLELVRTMRAQRAMLIQTTMQFRFVCQALYHVYKDKVVEPLPQYLSPSTTIVTTNHNTATTINTSSTTSTTTITSKYPEIINLDNENSNNIENINHCNNNNNENKTNEYLPLLKSTNGDEHS